MPKCLIERDLPGAGNLTTEQLRGVAMQSCAVLQAMGPSIQWVESHMTPDKVFCV